MPEAPRASRPAAGAFRFLLPVLFLAACTTLPGCAPSPATPLVLDGVTMGTTWEVKVADRPVARPADTLRRGVAGILDALDQAMSTYKVDSELSRFNRAPAGKWISLSPELWTVIAEARQISEMSSGAFDVTVGPLVNLWGFGPGGQLRRVPAETDVKAALARIGYRKLELDRGRHAARKAIPDLYLDLSAIAKGYAVDRVAAYLEDSGVENYLVEIGGEIRGRGLGPDGGAWRVGIERPIPAERGVERIVRLHDTGMATSGDYRNFFVQDGVAYSHTIDPATGRPVHHGLAAVTVVDSSTMRADALATALLVLGPERGFALAEREKLAALFIVHAGKGFVERSTSAFDTLAALYPSR